MMHPVWIKTAVTPSAQCFAFCMHVYRSLTHTLMQSPAFENASVQADLHSLTLILVPADCTYKNRQYNDSVYAHVLYYDAGWVNLHQHCHRIENRYSTMHCGHIWHMGQSQHRSIEASQSDISQIHTDYTQN